MIPGKNGKSLLDLCADAEAWTRKRPVQSTDRRGEPEGILISIRLFFMERTLRKISVLAGEFEGLLLDDFEHFFFAFVRVLGNQANKNASGDDSVDMGRDCLCLLAV